MAQSSASTPTLLPQDHAPPSPTIAFASPPPSAATRVVRPTTLHPVFVVQLDARLAVATIAPRPSIYVLLVHHVPIQMVWLLILDQGANVVQQDARLAVVTIAT